MAEKTVVSLEEIEDQMHKFEEQHGMSPGTIEEAFRSSPTSPLTLLYTAYFEQEARAAYARELLGQGPWGI